MRRLASMIVCGALVGAAIGAVVPAAAGAWTTAPGLTAGPQITGAGLLWQARSGVRLTTRAGPSRIVAHGGADLWVSGESDWIASWEPGGLVRTGRIGSPLRTLAALRSCPPEQASARGWLQPRPLLALTHTVLYAVVPVHCHAGRAARSERLVAIDLARGSVRSGPALPPGIDALAVAGARVAVARPLDESPTSGQSFVAVTVIDSRWRHIYTVDGAGRASAGLSLSVDAAGDVLVTSATFVPPAPSAGGWWASPAKHAAHVLESVLASNALGPGEGVLTGAAALADRRIVYAAGSGFGQRLQLLDTATGATRTLAIFPGEFEVLGLDVHGATVAWAQQGKLPIGRRWSSPEGLFFSCAVEPVTPVQLTSMSLSGTAAPPRVIGPPLPAADQPPCTDFES